MVLTLDKYKNTLGLFAGIDSMRFKRVVRPGDRLDMESEIVKLKGPLVKATVRASVDGETAAEGEIMVLMQPATK